MAPAGVRRARSFSRRLLADGRQGRRGEVVDPALVLGPTQKSCSHHYYYWLRRGEASGLRIEEMRPEGYRVAMHPSK